MMSVQYRVYALLALVVLSSWLLSALFQEESVEQLSVPQHSPDYFSVGYRKREMDDVGQVKNELIADRITHYSDDKTTHLVSPVMTLYNSEDSPWVVVAESGLLLADKDHLFLGGQVVIRRAATEEIKPLTINTSELQVTLSSSYAETAQWAEILDAENKTEGVGLEMTFVEPVRLKFLSQVKGRYEFN